jgi:iron complex outermembrane receptor protein
MRSRKLLCLASTAICFAALSSPASAQDEDEIVVTGLRQAYKGNFKPLEVPQAEITLDSKVLSIAGALNLDEALDLSASVARQNNFGGLWNSFSIRGFSGDINLPSGFLVNGFNAGRGFSGPRDLAGIERAARGPLWTWRARRDD